MDTGVGALPVAFVFQVMSFFVPDQFFCSVSLSLSSLTQSVYLSVCLSVCLSV
jgi:hypothetical protein